MGDRANVEILQTESAPPLYLYTHSQGSIWNQRLAQALKFGEGRWEDEHYLTRILITHMFSDLTGETGGGVGFVQYGDEYPLIVVEMEQQTIYLKPEVKGVNPIRESFLSYTYREHPIRAYGGYTEKSIHDV